jgi:hypothetical protein
MAVFKSMRSSILRFMKGVMPTKESSLGIAFGFKSYIRLGTAIVDTEPYVRPGKKAEV